MPLKWSHTRSSVAVRVRRVYHRKVRGSADKGLRLLEEVPGNDGS